MLVKSKNAKVTVSKDSMEVYLSCELTPDEIELRTGEIFERLENMGITFMPDKKTVEKVLSDAAHSGEPINNIMLTSGNPPVPPHDGQIKWARDFFNIEYRIDEKTGAINFRDRKENTNVEDGELLASLLPPDKGEKGTDVFGKPVSPPKPRKAKLRHGVGVRKEEKEGVTEFYATKDGKIRYAADKICVDDVYQVNGDVNLETGNIKHNGAVIISGNIREGASVEAEGNIEVHGSVEPCSIRTRGGLQVGKGITGNEKYSIRVSGSIKARYILNAEIECKGDVDVEKEIIQSRITLQGDARVKGGRIVGGRICALGQITAAEIGSTNSVLTETAAGVDPVYEKYKAEKSKEMEKIDATLEKIHAKVDPLMKRQKFLRPQQKEAATELLFHADEMKKKREKIQSEIDAKRIEYEEASRPYITVERIAYMKSKIILGSARLLLEDDINGPVKAENRNNRIEFRNPENDDK